jgi:putative sigma-54 modulation protein
MRLELTGRHVTISPGLRTLVDDKLARVLRQINDSGISAAVIVTKEKYLKVVDAAIHARGERFLHAVARAETWELAVNAAFEKLEQQARKMKGKWTQRKRRGTGPKARQLEVDAAANGVPVLPAQKARRVVRAARYAVKPMTVDEAALELDELDAAFLVFRDASTETVNVLYRRKDGQYGLIEPDA